MPTTGRDVRDIIGGAVVAACGLAFFYRSFAYGIGSLSEMGAGFFPMVLSAAAMIAGLAILLGGLVRKASSGRQESEAFALRPLLSVLGGIALFAVLLVPFGLAPAVAAAATVAGLGDPENSWPNLAMLAIVLAIGCWLIFSIGLKLPLPIIRGF